MPSLAYRRGGTEYVSRCENTLTEIHTDDEGDGIVVPIYSRLEFVFGVLYSLRDIQIVKVDRPFLMSLQ